MWTAPARRAQYGGILLLAALGTFAFLAARQLPAVAEATLLALATLPALPSALSAAMAALGGTWTAPGTAPALPAALVATPLFLSFGLTVVAGVVARKALAVVPRGAALGERARRTINRLVLWVTLPALVFDTVHGAPLGIDVLQGPVAAIAGMAGTALVAWQVLVRWYGRTPTTGGLVLAASAGSVSFLGIPMARALFDAGDARVAVYFAVLNVPLALVSAAFISQGIRGTGQRQRPAGVAAAGHAVEAVRQLFTLPATWALVAAVALNGIALPDGVVLPVVLLDGAERVLHALAGSVAPTVMFALGLGLRFERSLAPYRMALPAVAIKLAISPLVVLACAKLVGLSGPHLAIVALQGAMPTQVLSVVIAERYKLDARMVGLALAMNTALAFVLLPALVGAMHALGIT